MANDWTTEEDAKLRRFHADGETPAEMVERFPGRTRNAIVGRMNRLGLRTREAYIQKTSDRTCEAHELIIRLRCKPWNWSAASIAQALCLKSQTVHSVIHRETEPA